jgi:hypothetical protein
MNPFDFINAITQTKEDLFQDPQASKDYNAFMVNRGLSQYADTILYSNEMNIHYNLDPDMQFKYLINTITKKKRFSKWAKKEKDSKSFLLVKEYFKYSDEKARHALEILTNDQLAIIEQKLYKGGTK